MLAEPLARARDRKGIAPGEEPAGRQLAAKSGAGRWLELDAAAFRAGFNRCPFVIGHKLAQHPLFALPRLVELAQNLPEESVKYNAGDVSVAEGLYKGPRTGLSAAETIRRIEECGSWMVLKFVEQDAAYRQLLDECLDEIQALSEPLEPGMRSRAAFIFVSSPRAVTPYHIDPECNFLLQLRGRKTINILDGANRELLSEQELERFISTSENISFKEERQRQAAVFELVPGLGLHFPVTAPHWVRNGDEVSISFSITFSTAATERRAIIHSANYRLRQMGISPAPYGSSTVRDAVKFYGYRACRRARRLVRGG